MVFSCSKQCFFSKCVDVCAKCLRQCILQSYGSEVQEHWQGRNKMLEGVWSIHSHNTHLIQISQYKWWYLLTNFSNHLYSRISQDISSLDICTIDSNGTGGYSLHFTAVFMRAVLPTSVYDSIVYDSRLFMTALLLMVWQDFLLYLFTYLHDNINRWIVLVPKPPTVQLLEVTRKSMVEWPENKVMEKVLECTNLPLSSGLTL